ncbi:MAG: hypothetical protein L6R37_001658 [Teloschistes peruensis]|nr:MAG: hypothetical protein L6R37_001658 [Teloschistes peruensis]
MVASPPQTSRLKRIAVGMHMLGMLSLIAVQANIASNVDALEPELARREQRGNVDWPPSGMSPKDVATLDQHWSASSSQPERNDVRNVSSLAEFSALGWIPGPQLSSAASYISSCQIIQHTDKSRSKV